MSSGGTESLLLSCLVYRERAKYECGITEPEIVIPVTAHAAFDKAGKYFHIKVIRTPLEKGNTGKADIDAMRAAITRNTIAIVGSAPGFPHGIVDDIEALGRLAEEKNLPLHVDCCMGGYLLPFMDKAGFPIAPFDFRIKAVTSISCDPHKFGFTPKGNSVIMYRNAKLRSYQYCVSTDWPGGIYASPTMAGSRPGCLIAGCWATLLYFGVEGYVKSTKTIITTARKLKAGIQRIEGLQIFGDPQCSIISFQSDRFDVLRLAHPLSLKGWRLSVLQFPPAVHMCCTYLTNQSIEDLLNELEDLTQEMLKEPKKRLKVKEQSTVQLKRFLIDLL
jgi:sphinganine-1-phosphate aldolase